MNYYYDFSEMLRELEELNGTQSNMYTEIAELREELKTYNEQQTQGMTLLTALLVALTVLQVVFK